MDFDPGHKLYKCKRGILIQVTSYINVKEQREASIQCSAATMVPPSSSHCRKRLQEVPRMPSYIHDQSIWHIYASHNNESSTIHIYERTHQVLIHRCRIFQRLWEPIFHIYSGDLKDQNTQIMDQHIYLYHTWKKFHCCWQRKKNKPFILGCSKCFFLAINASNQLQGGYFIYT